MTTMIPKWPDPAETLKGVLVPRRMTHDEWQADEDLQTEWIDARCAALLPSTPVEMARPFMAALIHTPTETAFRELLDTMPVGPLYAAEDVASIELLLAALPGAYLAADESTLTIPTPSTEATRRARRARRNPYVITSHGGLIGGKVDRSEPTSLRASECIARADLWAVATSGEHLVPLLGTEARSWEEVTPPLANVNMGDSVTSEARKPRQHRPRSARYATVAKPKYVTPCSVPSLTSDARLTGLDYGMLHELRTTFDGMVRHGIRGAWIASDNAKNRKSARVRRADALPVESPDELCARARGSLESLYAAREPGQLKYRIAASDHRATVTHDPAGRKFIVSVSVPRGDGKRTTATRTVRSIDAAVGTLARLTT